MAFLSKRWSLRMINSKITIELDKNKALVLFELIVKLTESENYESAEQNVLNEIECLLEKQLSEPFEPNYLEIIAKARNQIQHTENNYFKKNVLIELIKEQMSNRIDLIAQLQNIKTKKWLKKPYINLVDNKNANQKGAEWQFKESIVLEHKAEGTIVLDILKDGRIGGFELIDQLE